MYNDGDHYFHITVVIGLICPSSMCPCSDHISWSISFCSSPTVRRQNMKVRINATGDTIVMKFLRPSPNVKLEGYILGYGSNMFSKQFIQLPENGQPYETEVGKCECRTKWRTQTLIEAEKQSQVQTLCLLDLSNVWSRPRSKCLNFWHSSYKYSTNLHGDH